MPNLHIKPKMTIGKIKIYQESGSGEYYIKIGNRRTRRLSKNLFRSKKRK